MLRIEISIPRPIETLLIVLAFVAGALWVRWELSVASPQAVEASAISSEGAPSSSSRRSIQELRHLAFPSEESQNGSGGPDTASQSGMMDGAINDARRIRAEQVVLEHREEILRYQLDALREEARLAGPHGSPSLQSDVQSAESALLALIQNRQEAEQRFHDTLQQMWEAEGLSAVAAIGSPGTISLLAWPVEPQRGLSAVFRDVAYEERFGIPHLAIDIPTDQNTVIRAPADGVVEKVADNGTGYSFLIIQHHGFSTVYGHVSAFLVTEGQHVTQGDPIALSGGRPGSRGAGALTTGPHLHFEVLVSGKHVDPLTVLPQKI